MQAKKTAVIYARVSDRKQVEEDVSLPSQVEECKKKADALSASVLRVFVEEGRTGRHTDRPAFQDAIAFCELHAPAYFITWSTSRFARNRFDAALYKRRLSAVGTEMIYITLTVDRSNVGGRALEAFFEIIDELQSDQIAADTRRSMLRNAREGFRNGGRPPFGFSAVSDSANPKRKRLTPFEEEAAIVRGIVARRLDGLGAKSIALELNDAGTTNRGRRWTKGTIGDLLRNEALLGRTVFGKKDRVTGRRRQRADWIVVKSHEPIISQDQWDAVQALMNQGASERDSGSPLSRFLFTGLLKCSKCGASLLTESAKGRSRRYHYYNCRSAQMTKQCHPRRIPAHEFDEWMVAVVVSRIFTEENLRWVLGEMASVCSAWATDRNRRRSDVAKKIRATQDRNSRLYEILELHGKDAPNLGDLTKRLRGNNLSLKRFEQELAEIEVETEPTVAIGPGEIAELSEFLAGVLKTSENVAKVRSFLGAFIETIRVGESDVIIDYNPQCLIEGRRERLTVPSVDGWLPGTGLLGTVRVTEALPARWRRVA